MPFTTFVPLVLNWDLVMLFQYLRNTWLQSCVISRFYGYCVLRASSEDDDFDAVVQS